MARTHFDQKLKRLEEQLLRMGTQVSETLHLAVDSLARQDLDLARKIIEADDHIDALDLKLEEDCLRLLALQQPLAKDLRIITTVLKAATDLERVADQAANIAEITLRIGEEPLIKPLIDIPYMGVEVEEMIHFALEALVERDAEKARQICLQDELIDEQYENLLLELMDYIQDGGDRKRMFQIMNLLFTARFLERVGDHAVNIGERVIYLVEGVLTAKEAEIDRVLGLELGADDYVTKPFSLRELLARVKTVLRRSNQVIQVPEEEFIRFDELEIDLMGQEVKARREKKELTAKEFELLKTLAMNPGRVLSRDQLLDRVWGHDFYGDPRTVDVHIRWLREKIEIDPGDPRYILTVRGSGYKFRRKE